MDESNHADPVHVRNQGAVMEDDRDQRNQDAPEANEGSQDQRNLIDAAWQQVERARSTEVLQLASPGGGGIDARPAWLESPPPEFLPGYRIIGEIHRGGQGVVYEAVQESTNRTVAIKIMRDGPFAGPREKARFDREVQILARLKHPNIVTIHDSGIAPGAVFFVMDYIAGEQLDNYVEVNEPDLRTRLRLFAKICAAVNVAHLRGIIHRDLKPGNIRIDEEGEPHVLDFGLAKQSEWGDAAADEDDLTVTGQFLGSLPWASPEQAEGRQHDVDVRTDVYALGVILYQLLTGEFPYKVSGSLTEMANNIVHTEPRNPRAVNRDLDDDVATIALKALRKDRELRYQSAGMLGREIERYLAGEPIEAKRDSMGYIVRKHLVRHKMAVGVALGFVLLVTVGFVVSLSFWRQAVVARDAERLQRESAQAEAARAKAVIGFLQEMLTAADPTGELGPNVTVQRTLEAAAEELDSGSLADQPLVEAMARTSVGMTFLRLGAFDKAEPQLTKALEIRRNRLGDANIAVVESLNDLGMLARAQGRLEDAERFYQDAMKSMREAGLERDRLALDLHNNLALLLYKRGNVDEAERHFEKLVALEGELLAADNPKRATALNNYALLLRDKGEWDRAEEMWRETLQILRAAYGDEHMHVAAVLESLGSLRMTRGDLATAESLYTQAMEMRRKVLGEDHPDYASSLNNLGYFYFTKGDLDRAEPLYREALRKRRKLLGDDHHQVASVLNNLALLLAQQERYGEAETLYREALEIKKDALGEEHPRTLLQMYNLAATLRKSKRVDEAERLIRRVVESAKEVLPEGHWELAAYRGEWGACLAELGRFDQAEKELVACYEGFLAKLGPEHVRTVGVVERIVKMYQDRGWAKEAQEWRAKLPATADPQPS